jgi:hypothetical protein
MMDIKEGAVEEIKSYVQIPYNVISEDVSSSAKREFYNELGQIVEMYNVYKKGAKVDTEGSNGDYAPSDIRFKKCKILVDKEARFLFSNTPDFTVNKNSGKTLEEKDQNTILNTFIDKVLKSNNMSSILVRAAKDCFIGKRVACMLNFDSIHGISITFLTSLEFIAQYDRFGSLKKIVAFYAIVNSSNLLDKRINKKVYEMHDDGFCYSYETIYDGAGTVIEETVPLMRTAFDYIPAVVICNDGLLGDTQGESEIENEVTYEAVFSKLASGDIDAERKTMNPVRWTADASAESTEKLSSAPGAYWDLHSDENGSDSHTVTAGILESTMSYSGPVKTTLDRLSDQMYAQVDVPDINSERLQGVVTSGKTLKALYWGLIVRCDEKMLVWGPALQFVVKTILEGAILYPDSAKIYIQDPIPVMDYDIEVVNNYPLPEDETEEKGNDLSEVGAQTLSKKSYMKKWRHLTDEEADEELQQILKEKQMLEDGQMPDAYADTGEGDMSGASDGEGSGEDDEEFGADKSLLKAYTKKKK